MAKINHLDMGPTVMGLEVVTVKKGFLGMSTKLIYNPTNSVIKIVENEYSAEDGRKLADILNTAPEHVEDAIAKFPVSAVGMGNVKLQACISEDHQFAAVQLMQFKDFDYKPSSEVRIYQGKTAEVIATLF